MRTLKALALAFAYGLLVLIIQTAAEVAFDGVNAALSKAFWLFESFAFLPLAFLLRALKCSTMLGVGAIVLSFVAYTLPFSLFAVFFNQQRGAIPDFFESFQWQGCVIVVFFWLCMRYRDSRVRRT